MLQVIFCMPPSLGNYFFLFFSSKIVPASVKSHSITKEKNKNDEQNE